MKKNDFIQAVKLNDIVDIIAPGYPFEIDTLNKSIDYLNQRGFTPRISKDILKPDYFHSHSDEKRFLNFKKAILAKDSRIVWCLRGGYGSNRLIPEILKLKKPNYKKIFIGISDVTTLHLFLNQKWGWSTLHASLLDRLALETLPKENEVELWNILLGKTTEVEFKNIKSLNQKAQSIKKMEGSIIGGNLTTLQSAIGTKIDFDLKGQFLFLEDFGERGYRVDRMLEHLVQANKFKNAKGILIGQFIGGNEPNSQFSRVDEAILRFAKVHNEIPVWCGIESGHDKNLRTLPFGTQAVISKEKSQYVLKVKTGIKK